MSKYLADGKTTRCRKVDRFGNQCIKQKSHARTELDVVHKAGMFVWRDEPFYIGRSDGGPSKEDLPLQQTHSSTADVGSDGDTRDWPSSEPLTVTFKTDRGINNLTEFIKGLTIDQTRLLDTPTADAAFHSMCTDKCGPECTSPDSPYEVLASWWIDQANVEIERTVPKAIEYSATDLTDIGHDLARTAGREVSDEEAAELGVFFYLRGKMARWVGAVIAGERVSDDTLFDIGVYVRMAQRIRQFGSWPGTEKLNETGR